MGARDAVYPASLGSRAKRHVTASPESPLHLLGRIIFGLLSDFLAFFSLAVSVAQTVAAFRTLDLRFLRLQPVDLEFAFGVCVWDIMALQSLLHIYSKVILWLRFQALEAITT
jgi:hypothetical protein